MFYLTALYLCGKYKLKIDLAAPAFLDFVGLIGTCWTLAIYFK